MTAAGIALPTQAVDRYLRQHASGLGAVADVRKFDLGQSNPTFLVVTDVGRYVLRAKPAGRLLKSAHAIDREFQVLNALHGTTVPVPKPIHYCSDESAIGSEFYVMEYVQGDVFWNPELPELRPVTRSIMYDEMNRVLAALHGIDVAAVGLADFGKPGGYFERQINRWTAQYRASETEPRTDLERLIEWLPANLPEDDGQVSLVHGDFRLDNMVFDPAGRILAVLDWELSTLGHPYADLAYQCAQWRLPAGDLRGLKGVDRGALGIPTETDYVAAYLRRRGLPPAIPGWTFYLVVSLFRLAAICQGVYRRGLDGNASSTVALGFGPKVDVIAREAVAILSGTRH
jgi:aminoglycoside phosphotransferase (APT) family kinase protein